MADKIAYTKINLSKKNAISNEKITIQVYVYSVASEPINKRLPFVVGSDAVIK